MLHKLAELGQSMSCYRVYLDEKNLGVASYIVKTGEIDYIGDRRIGGLYHGTGDIFASALVAGLLNGYPLKKAAEIAVDFTIGSIERTKEAGTDLRFGVDFESGLPELARRLGKI
jgi:pyridoxine kinase